MIQQLIVFVMVLIIEVGQATLKLFWHTQGTDNVESITVRLRGKDDQNFAILPCHYIHKLVVKSWLFVGKDLERGVFAKV